jgi:hypothetical protein
MALLIALGKFFNVILMFRQLTERSFSFLVLFSDLLLIPALSRVATGKGWDVVVTVTRYAVCGV